MTDETLPELPGFADGLPHLERAKLGLEDELTVFEIVALTYPNGGDLEKRRQLTDFLLEAIKAEKLMASGDPNGCKTTVQFSPEGEAHNEGPFSYAQSHQGTRRTLRRREQLVSDCFGLVRMEEQEWHGDNCLVDWIGYHLFLATPAALGIPKPNWPTCPKLKDVVPYEQAKARLHASDADMCGWTLSRSFQPNRGLIAYEKFNGRLHPFVWTDNAKLDVPWLTQLRALWFVRAEVEHFHPDPNPDIHYLTYSEAITRIQQALPAWSRTDIENQLWAVAGARMPELNLDLVARDPLAAKRKLSRHTLPECLFLADQIDEFVQQYGNDQTSAQAEFFETYNQQDIVESSELESDEFLDHPRPRNAHPIGLFGDYQQWKPLDAHPNPVHLDLRARDGSLRVAVKVNRLRAYRVPGRPDPSKSDVDYEDGWSRDGTPPKGSPLLRVEGFWYLEGQEAFRVLSGFKCRVNWLLPTDVAELHRRWPDLFPDNEFYLDLENWMEVRREDLFWLDAPSQPIADPLKTVPPPAIPQSTAIVPAATEPKESVLSVPAPDSGAAAKRAAVEQLLAEIDKRAIEQNAGFNRHSLPGTKQEFHKLLKVRCLVFQHVTITTVKEYLKSQCQFQPGAKPKHGKGAAIWALFPEHDLK